MAWKRPEIPLPSWIHAIGGGTFIFGVVGVAAVSVLLYLAFEPKVDQVEARPAAASLPSTTTPVALPVQTNPVEMIRFVDTTGRGNVDFSDVDVVPTRARLEEAVAREPRNADALNSLGLLLEHLGQIQGAASRFSGAVAADSHNWIYHFNLAHAASVQQRWQTAASEYAAVLEVIPTNYAAQYNLAVALHYSSNDPAAISAFEKAIALAPDEPAAHLSLAVSLDAAGRSADAVSEYRRYLQLAPAAANAATVKARVASLGRES